MSTDKNTTINIYVPKEKATVSVIDDLVAFLNSLGCSWVDECSDLESPDNVMSVKVSGEYKGGKEDFDEREENRQELEIDLLRPIWGRLGEYCYIELDYAYPESGYNGYLIFDLNYYNTFYKTRNTEEEGDYILGFNHYLRETKAEDIKLEFNTTIINKYVSKDDLIESHYSVKVEGIGDTLNLTVGGKKDQIEDEMLKEHVLKIITQVGNILDNINITCVNKNWVSVWDLGVYPFTRGLIKNLDFKIKQDDQTERTTDFKCYDVHFFINSKESYSIFVKINSTENLTDKIILEIMVNGGLIDKEDIPYNDYIKEVESADDLAEDFFQGL